MGYWQSGRIPDSSANSHPHRNRPLKEGRSVTSARMEGRVFFSWEVILTHPKLDRSSYREAPNFYETRRVHLRLTVKKSRRYRLTRRF
jgi:hypothetical protein